VESVWPDEMHELRISVRGHHGKMARFDHQIRRDGLKSELGCGEWPRYDRDDPTRRSAGPIFEHRTDHPRDGQSLYGQLRLFAPILGVAAASRQFWINYLELLHAHRHGRGTRDSSANTTV